MENHQCEKCRLFKPTVELRSGDELLCDNCWKSPKEHSVLNATAKPFLPRSSGSSIAQRVVNRRRSWSTGAIIEMKNSQCETRTSTEKSIVQQGEEKETSVKDASSQILKSLTNCDSRSLTLKRLKELCKKA